MVSGQATQPDTQADCPYYDKFSGTLDMSGKLKTNPNYGQVVSAAGPNAAAGTNGCVYPASVPTLFNQLDAAHVSWKGYAQDLGNPDESGPVARRGCAVLRRALRRTGPHRQHRLSPTRAAPTAPTSTCPSTSPSPGSSRSWRSGDCNEAHIANLFSPPTASTTTCRARRRRRRSAGSRRTTAATVTTRSATATTSRAASRRDPLEAATRPTNRSTTPAGCTAADLFLEHVIPEIEESPAFKEGGLIDVTFDEGFPPFTYTGNSFSNSTIVPPECGHLAGRRRGGRDAVRQRAQLRAHRTQHAA